MFDRAEYRKMGKAPTCGWCGKPITASGACFVRNEAWHFDCANKPRLIREGKMKDDRDNVQSEPEHLANETNEVSESTSTPVEGSENSPQVEKGQE